MRGRIGQLTVGLGIVLSLVGALGAAPAAAADDDDEGNRGVLGLAEDVEAGDPAAFGGGRFNVLQLFFELTGD